MSFALKVITETAVLSALYVKIIFLQHVSGADLGILFVNVLVQSESQPSSEYFEKITHLFSLMSPFSPERESFIQSALRWSTKGTNHKTGDPELHQRIAQVFWRGKRQKKKIDYNHLDKRSRLKRIFFVA